MVLSTYRMILSGWFGMDFKNRKIDKWTSWDVPLSFTTQRDVARFVVHVLTMLSPDQLENRIFRIEGDRQVRYRPGRPLKAPTNGF